MPIEFVRYANLCSIINGYKGKLFLTVSVEDDLGTLPISYSAPAARPRLGHFSLSEAQSKFEK